MLEILSTPSGIVLVSYFLAAVLTAVGQARAIADEIPVPYVSGFTLAGVLVLGSSLYFQYAVISPETGLQNLLASVTAYFGIGVALVGVAKYFIEVK